LLLIVQALRRRASGISERINESASSRRRKSRRVSSRSGALCPEHYNSVAGSTCRRYSTSSRWSISLAGRDATLARGFQRRVSRWQCLASNSSTVGGGAFLAASSSSRVGRSYLLPIHPPGMEERRSERPRRRGPSQGAAGAVPSPGSSVSTFRRAPFYHSSTVI
jgi:hypothetical protein